MIEPPQLARRLLRLIPQPDREFIEGDLEEEFAARVSQGRTRANAWYWQQVLASLPWFVRPAIERLTHAITTADLQSRILAMAASLGGPARHATPHQPVFGSRLIASRPTRQDGTFATGLMSMAFHVGFLGSLVYSTVGSQVVNDVEEVEVVEVYQDFSAEPAPPPPPVEDAAPVETDIPDFVPPDQIPVDIPPPGKPITADDIIEQIIKDAQRDSIDDDGDDALKIGETPTFTPFEVAPEMQNRDEVARALASEYPPLLRDAGVGGRVVVWIRLDDQGTVEDAQVKESSGQQALDDAALRVARIIEFSPAMNRDKAVPVWVSIPITFQTR